MPKSNPSFSEKKDELVYDRTKRAEIIANAGGLVAARASGSLPQYIDVSVSEALVLGLLLQGVSTFVTVFGHGSTDIGEVLRIYHQVGLVRVFGVRSEIEASHAASALRWVTGEKAAVVTSIGPGALQALAGSLVPANDGLGVWYLFGDETTEDEGLNMQQIPKNEQALFLKLFSQMGQSYTLHTPLALPTALRRGLNTVDHPHRGGPFFLLLPMNVQALIMEDFNLEELPFGSLPRIGAAAGPDSYTQAADAIQEAKRVLVRIGGGGREAGPEISEFLEVADAVAITSPMALGVIPDGHPRNMTVGGSKGSLSGNYAMENADLLVVLGSRGVCQSDCSRTGYPKTKHVININVDMDAVTHYGKTTTLLGDIGPTLSILTEILQQSGLKSSVSKSPWFTECTQKRQAWDDFRSKRYNHPTIYDEVWGKEVLTQPAAIKAAADWAKTNQAVCFFDAGDVQANGFQIFESDSLGQVITDTGASYMGFAVSALLANALSKKTFYGIAFSGDGSFTMNSQILIDGVEHDARGCILLFDNRRMAAISGLQLDQYGHDFATNDGVSVDYVAWAKAIKGVNAIHGGYTTATLTDALEQAKSYPGLSLIHVPVYFGPNELGGMGVFGRWNVGNWSEDTQKLRHEIGL
jgi:3D-(3,5/4)-trihydroxycyclohexane-1,2-dione acylhydrolase (decyclizing)